VAAQPRSVGVPPVRERVEDQQPSRCACGAVTSASSSSRKVASSGGERLASQTCSESAIAAPRRTSGARAPRRQCSARGAVRGFPASGPERDTARMASPSLLVLDDARHVGLTAAELRRQPDSRAPQRAWLLPTGHTPRGLYAALRDHAADGSLPSSTSRCSARRVPRPRSRGSAQLPRRAGRELPDRDRPARGSRRRRRRPRGRGGALPGHARHRPGRPRRPRAGARCARRLQRARVAARRRRAPRGTGPVDRRGGRGRLRRSASACRARR
jgi:hypothetical protein